MRNSGFARVLRSSRRMGGDQGRQVDWLVRGDRVGLAAPEREQFVARWNRYDDPRIGMIAAFQTAGSAILKPPTAREHREALWQAVADGVLVPFDIRTTADGSFVGEAGVSRVQWPRGSGDVAAALFDPADR